ncbi:hypothetical protein CDL12_00719 [Handroanthus impetiginosus]|uniref:DRBM domain-containing protein n=1 Tax=Handroanthus impetiginosus TaxID=429701 RepID=A0A2G9I9T7_9LAMI|nr:hypothetical protein CDL12_00719 [Handroanthus impetiginosus]
MASGSESTSERGTEKWEVGLAKNVVQALMETLVDPRLPLRVSVDDPPSEYAQKSVAKQMHAVVLLYNYYHRKQKTELEFIDFVSFCKLALLLRPSLNSFMKMMELNSAENQLSVTEKAMKDACDIAMALDASKDVPTIEGCPISKVAVLLIDQNRENCLLQFGAVTEGVWSLIDKELNESNLNQEAVAAEYVDNKRKRNSQGASAYDSKFLQLGYDAVKDVTGIDSSDLVVLEAHVAYSLSKKKSAARFYIMQCPQSFSINQRVPLRFLAESLQGPLVEKDYDSWMTTTVVEYYHMLPYVGFISCWLSRKNLCLPSLNNRKDLDQIDNNSSEMEVSSSGEVANGNSGKAASSVNISQSAVKDGNVMDNTNKRCDLLDSATKGASRITPESLSNNRNKHETGSISGPSRGLQSMNMSDSTKTCPKSEDTRSKLNSNIRVLYQRKRNISSVKHNKRGLEDGFNLKVKIADPVKSNDTLCKDDIADAVKGSSTQTGIAVMGHALVPVEPLHYIEVKNVQASDDLQNALALLYRKRQELWSQICIMEDTLALHEDNIERIRDGGEVDLARHCIKSVISGNNHLLRTSETQSEDKGHQLGEDHCNPQPEKETGLSATFLPGRSPCQDLEYVCLKNNWRLPRYFVEPSGGKFASNVVVESKNMKLSSKGSCESSPCEARKSAAANMIAKIRNTSFKAD